MTPEELTSQDGETLPIGKLISIIARNYTVYFNHHLEQFGINASQFHFLFEIYNQKEINQEKIALRCGMNKGAVARSIKKLEDKGLVVRQVDENNRRQNKVSLTSKGRETLEKAYEILNDWEDEVIVKKGYIEKELLQKLK